MTRFSFVNRLLSGDIALPNMTSNKANKVYCDYVIARINDTEVDWHPFGHLYIENILPDDLYSDLAAYMQLIKQKGIFCPRTQDNPEFTNRKYSFSNSSNPAVVAFRSIFLEAAVKKALLTKFYSENLERLSEHINIHSDEFEFTFTKAQRFQNIHVDIPAKYLSFVFYMPNDSLSETEAKLNGTILYDSNLMPHYKALYKTNSVCIFAPHFQSYHGFSSTIDRDVIVMFYVNETSLKLWKSKKLGKSDSLPYTMIRDLIQEKLIEFPLIEVGKDLINIKEAREKCLINSPDGRVIQDNDPRPLQDMHLMQ